jgi:predicted O-methyltransferase YrrM
MLPEIAKPNAPPIDWCGLHREYTVSGEMEIIAAMFREIEARSVIEIGCRDGRTAQVLLANVPTLRRYIGIDVPPSYAPGLDHQRAEMVDAPGHLAASDQRFSLLICERGSLDIGPQDIEQSCDAIYIDGDHSLRAVSHDSHLARALVRPGGLIIWHDYNDAVEVEVRPVLDHLADQGWPIVHIRDTWLAFMRVHATS